MVTDRMRNMSTQNKYFARFLHVLFPRYRIGQRTVVNSRAIHLNTLPGYSYSVSLLAVKGKRSGGRRAIEPCPLPCGRSPKAVFKQGGRRNNCPLALSSPASRASLACPSHTDIKIYQARHQVLVRN